MKTNRIPQQALENKPLGQRDHVCQKNRFIGVIHTLPLLLGEAQGIHKVPPTDPILGQLFN